MSGGVEDLFDRGAGWRQIAKHQLEQWGYETVTPLLTVEQEANMTPGEIVQSNLDLQSACDMLLVAYEISPRASFGTDYEITIAKEILNQPVIAWAHKDYVARVYLNYIATAILPTLNQAMEFIHATYPIQGETESMSSTNKNKLYLVTQLVSAPNQTNAVAAVTQGKRLPGVKIMDNWAERISAAEVKTFSTTNA